MRARTRGWRRPGRARGSPPRSPAGRCRPPLSRRSSTLRSPSARPTLRPSGCPPVRPCHSLEARRPPAAHAIAPAYVHLDAARRTAQLARRWLAALRAEVHFAAGGEGLAAVRALPRRVALLSELERRLEAGGGGARGGRAGRGAGRGFPFGSRPCVP